MRGLRKYLAPFAPDQSGASAVLSDLGGIIVICDAGGCAGNICGFDEPRWFLKKSAIFSAGLRDMDAIMGRDDRLVEKLADACKKVEANFAVIVGTPVPAVIGTDYRALQRMAEKKIDIPVMTVECTGMVLYDEGEEKTWLELFKTFAKEPMEVIPGSVGILGATPLEVHSMEADLDFRQWLMDAGASEVHTYGMDGDMEAVKRAPAMEKNLVISPSGWKAAKYLRDHFGTPFECVYPGADVLVEKYLAEKGLTLDDLRHKKVLVMHQQIYANSVRNVLRQKLGADAGEINVASWFMLKPSMKEAGDVRLKEEDDFEALVMDGGYDVIIGDDILANAIRKFEGTYINLPHFAVSGKV